MRIAICDDDEKCIARIEGYVHDLNGQCICDKYLTGKELLEEYSNNDRPDTERTLENITNELHKCLQGVGLTRYTLAAHSLFGIYCLAYANKYPDEVKVFIGINSSVPQQFKNEESTEKNIVMIRVRRNCARSKLLRHRLRTGARNMLKMAAKDYIYSKEDVDTYADLLIDHLDGETSMDELQHSDENFKGLIDTHFPKAMPVLFMLSEASPKELPDRGKYHEELLGENPGYMVTLGEHHYLHLAVPKAAAEEMDSFMEKYVLQTGALPTSG